MLCGHVKKIRHRSKSLKFCRYLLTLDPATVRPTIVCANCSQYLTIKRCRQVADWAAAHNVEIACTPTNSSWLNDIEARSPPCATSPSTVPTTAATKSEAA
ncbi:hypothetical protein [Streptomyces mirabilis]|jgi:hypothetical protein|uniref:DDE superfamily endonuclease n=1 Tax=Streptomyces mirabilis TaxID=68239 RepID=A0A1I2N0S8_9ACTN|nr:hypothetical protein [Streptomyces mirabilis]SFF94981.1 hypothetical protein SAMN02787118_1142 [Streptomyces mirabilis]